MNKEQKELQKVQQDLLRIFYKKYLDWKSDLKVGTWLGAGWIEFMFLIYTAIPFQELLEPSDLVLNLTILGMTGAFAPMVYLTPYISFKEEQKNCSVYEKLKYLPVNYREIQKMRMNYLVGFVGKMFPIALLLQMATSWFSYREISWKNIVYIIGVAFIFPILINMPIALWGKGSGR